MASLNFDVLENAFHSMSDEEREIITSVHPLLDNASFTDAANLVSMTKNKFNNCLDKILNRFPELKEEIMGRERGRRKGPIKEEWSGQDTEMEEFVKTLGLEPVEYEFLRLIHPIFDINMTKKQACETLGFSRPTGRKILNNLISRFPALIWSTKRWANSEERSQDRVENPMRFGDLDDPYFGEDKIVRIF